jgi:hypothetical protein
MGQVVYFNGISIRVNPRDHKPAHVHVTGNGGNARYNLETKSWMDSRGFSKRDLNAIEEVILRRHEDCMAEWRHNHESEE